MLGTKSEEGGASGTSIVDRGRWRAVLEDKERGRWTCWIDGGWAQKIRREREVDLLGRAR
jgi:hypothetical protein